MSGRDLFAASSHGLPLVPARGDGESSGFSSSSHQVTDLTLMTSSNQNTSRRPPPNTIPLGSELQHMNSGGTRVQPTARGEQQEVLRSGFAQDGGSTLSLLQGQGLPRLPAVLPGCCQLSGDSLSESVNGRYNAKIPSSVVRAQGDGLSGPGAVVGATPPPTPLLHS